ncbi:SLATT domain-containing protein [Paenibacillus sp. FSL M7-0547]|uniref:SLATT domain-containing protein n=1 Tax=Paenibacillus sp. FSL M7-0547 TaxID=2954755 RepID=UPI0030FB6E54
MKEDTNEEIEVTNSAIFRDLKRRVKITRKARIIASRRLRSKYEYYEKVTHIYSLIILVLSIWFITAEGPGAIIATKSLLILSLSLTFFTMYVNIKNYKERASNFESNYQSLDILLNKIERLEATVLEIDSEDLKGLHREYEKVLLEKENHLDIDYMMTDEKKFKSKICVHNIFEFAVKLIVAFYPLILLLVIFLASQLLKMVY